MRIWMADVVQYRPPVAIGEVMRCFGLAGVLESRHPRYKKGDKIVGLTSLQDYVLLDVAGQRRFKRFRRSRSFRTRRSLESWGLPASPLTSG
jgi:NADPH-dependent curcumin reductase CurA